MYGYEYESDVIFVTFLHGSISTLFRRGGHFSCVCVEFLPAYNGKKL